MIGTGFVALGAGTAALAFLDALLLVGFGVTPLEGPTSLASLLLLVGTPLVFLACASSPALPAAIFLPLIAIVTWVQSGAPPLPLWTGTPASHWLRIAIQGIACAAAFVLWPRLAPPGGEARSSGVRFGAIVTTGIVSAPILAAALLVLSASTWLELYTRGFLQMDLEGVQIAERSYRLGDREVRLVGMMHIGDTGSYGELFSSFAEPGTLILQEGVSDREALLERQLSYGPLAERLGLESQAGIESYFEEAWEQGDPDQRWPHIRSADLDVADFGASTRAFLESAAALWGAATPADAFDIYLGLWRQPIDLDLLLDDIIVRRNREVLGALDEELESYPTIIVPWGALHLPGIEAGLEERGFLPGAESLRPLLRWHSLF